MNTEYGDAILNKTQFIDNNLKFIVSEDNMNFDLFKEVKIKLPNMVSLSDNGWHCKILLRTMIAMIRQ